jgi:hypothetical protein
MIPVAMAPMVSAALAAIAGGLGVTFAFSLVILGGARFADMRRAGRPVVAGVYAALGGIAGLCAIGLVVLGLILVTTK